MRLDASRPRGRRATAPRRAPGAAGGHGRLPRPARFGRARARAWRAPAARDRLRQTLLQLCATLLKRARAAAAARRRVARGAGLAPQRVATQCTTAGCHGRTFGPRRAAQTRRLHVRAPCATRAAAALWRAGCGAPVLPVTSTTMPCVARWAPQPWAAGLRCGAVLRPHIERTRARAVCAPGRSASRCASPLRRR
jgi:hypothetical protein